MAQFSHPELGGMGQRSRGGMLMIGDMFNHDLKARVDRMCSQLARESPRATRARWRAVRAMRPHRAAARGGGRKAWGFRARAALRTTCVMPSSPTERRLAIGDGGDVTVYDTAGPHDFRCFATTGRFPKPRLHQPEGRREAERSSGRYRQWRRRGPHADAHSHGRSRANRGNVRG